MSFPWFEVLLGRISMQTFDLRRPSLLTANSSSKVKLKEGCALRLHYFDLLSSSEFECLSGFLWPGNQVTNTMGLGFSWEISLNISSSFLFCFVFIFFSYLTPVQMEINGKNLSLDSCLLLWLELSFLAFGFFTNVLKVMGSISDLPISHQFLLIFVFHWGSER